MYRDDKITSQLIKEIMPPEPLWPKTIAPIEPFKTGSPTPFLYCVLKLTFV